MVEERLSKAEILGGKEGANFPNRRIRSDRGPDAKSSSLARIPVRKWLPLSSRRIIGSMVATIFIVIIITESVGRLHHESALVEGLSHIFALLVTLVPIFYFLWCRPLYQQMRERQRSESEVRDLSHRLLVASEEERRKLARDLHDEFGQKLTSLQMGLEKAGKTTSHEPSQFNINLEHLADLARELGDDLRVVVAQLRPNLLEELGIGSALEVYFTSIREQQPELKIDFTCNGLRERPSPEAEMVLYRVSQEALTNILKHARASKVTVRLAVSYPQIILTIQDDGVGFDLIRKDRTGRLNGFGLVGMRERVASLGGCINIDSRLGRGARIRVELPITTERRE